MKSKITLTMEKERRKRKSEEKERRRREKKSNGCTLSFYNGYLGDSFLPKKKLALTFSKIRLEIYIVNLTAPASWGTGVFKYRYVLFVSVVS